MTTRVINCTGGNRNYDVYIGILIRFHPHTYPQSKWGNPFKVKKYGREKAIEMYREYIMNKPELLELIPTELKDKRWVAGANLRNVMEIYWPRLQITKNS